MNLTYIGSKNEKIPFEIRPLFDNFNVITTSNEDLHQKVPLIEAVMRENGSVPYDKNDFVLCGSELKELGEVISRNRFNYGIVGENNEFVEIGEYQIKPEIKIGGIKIKLVNSVQFPHKGKQKILLVGPHYEEESVLLPAQLHKKQGDEIFVSIVTNIPNRPNLEKITHEVYQKDYGFSEKEYSFMGIADREVVSNKEKFMNSLDQILEKFRPDTIITTPKGSNFDHNCVVELTYERIKQKNINFILANVLQNTKFRPSIYPVIDQYFREKFLETYSEKKIGGGPDHKYSIDNLFSPLPESLNRYVSILKANNKISPDEKIGVFSLQPVKLVNGYMIPHKTRIFNLS